MKKSILTFTAILACSFFAKAQEVPRGAESEENAQDKIEQEPTQPTERALERNTKITAEREKREKEIIEAEKQKTKVKSKTKQVEKKSTAITK